MKTQRQPIGAELKPQVIQENLRLLFEDAHEHQLKDALPSVSDGAKRDIAVVDDGTSVFICVKTSRGWFRTDALTAL